MDALTRFALVNQSTAVTSFVHTVRACALCSVLFLLLTSSCASHRRTMEVRQRITQDHCEINSSHTSGYVFRLASIQAGSVQETLLRGRYGPRALHMVQAVGLTPRLVKLTRPEPQETGDMHSTTYLSVQQRITNQLQLATTDIATASALLDCDLKRATQAVTLLTRQ